MNFDFFNFPNVVKRLTLGDLIKLDSSYQAVWTDATPVDDPDL